MNNDLDALVENIGKAKSIVLSTHRQCDGDGLGAQLGLFHALKQLGKSVRILNVDATPSKYHFLFTGEHIQSYEEKHQPLQKTDLALILDTNDRRLVGELYGEFEKNCEKIIFIDHHPRLRHGPAPTDDSYIDTSAASTGEIAFRIIKKLSVRLNREIARAIYTSIVFDTQLFRYVRNSPTSHLIAAELLNYEKDPAEIHRFLFANHSVEKIRFLSHALEKIEYYLDGRIALLLLDHQDLSSHRMSAEDSRDLIDFIMNIDTLVVGVMIRQDAAREYKLSFRSKGQVEVRSLAESLGGGGHLYAAGATMKCAYDDFKDKVVRGLTELIERSDEKAKA